MPDTSEPDDAATSDIDALIASWQPQSRNDVMQRAFAERCKWIEKWLRVRTDAEIAMRASNFASGKPIEAIFREELAKILPRRYQVTCGTLFDRKGMTAGDCDIVVFNDIWFATIKQRPTEDDREHVMPIEGAYAVLECKQTLSLQTLDEAMEKLVKCHRLHRPVTPLTQVVENRVFSGGSGRVGNPLFSAIVATRLDPAIELGEIVERFVAINRKLKRREMVHCLCILEKVCYFWGWAPVGTTEAQIATFTGPDDLIQPLLLAEAVPENDECPLGALVARLYAHLTNSVLSEAHDIPFHYGIGQDFRPALGGLRVIPSAALQELG